MHNLEDILKDASTKIVYLSKSSLVQRVGEKTNKSYFVKKGLLRGYTIDEKGKEHIFMFAPEGWIISDIESHTLSSLSVLYIDALEDSEVVVFNRYLMDTSKMSKDIIQEKVGCQLEGKHHFEDHQIKKNEKALDSVFFGGNYSSQ